TDHEYLRVEDLYQVGQAVAQPVADVPEGVPGGRVTGPRGPGHQRTGDRRQVAAGQLQQDRRPLRILLCRRPGEAHQGVAAGVLLDAAALATAARPPVRYRRDVPQLAGDPVRAPQQLTAQHQAATDAGTHGEHHHRLGRVGRGAELELGPGR